MVWFPRHKQEGADLSLSAFCSEPSCRNNFCVKMKWHLSQHGHSLPQPEKWTHISWCFKTSSWLVLGQTGLELTHCPSTDYADLQIKDLATAYRAAKARCYHWLSFSSRDTLVEHRTGIAQLTDNWLVSRSCLQHFLSPKVEKDATNNQDLQEFDEPTDLHLVHARKSNRSSVKGTFRKLLSVMDNH